MNIMISEEALKWFKEEVGVEKGDTIKFFVRYGGSSPVQQNFSLSFTTTIPDNIAAKKEIDGILFFIEDNDLWFFNEYDLHVKYSKILNEIEYEYKQ
ncbi:HesB/YadR/YfhF family protein [Metabacillus fastidiosus]|uniref:HesB/YadR/YfhF family protein n=1 Tax=Metabacillus fastidiosus TaxID=1458 RepID=UPI003D2A8AA1